MNVFKVLSIKAKAGPKIKNKNNNEIEIFYNEHFKDLINDDKIDAIYLSQIKNDIATNILTAIENNIKLHFIEYIKRFINSSFKKINNNIIDSAEFGTKVKIRKQLNKDLYEIKEDILNNTLKCDKKYHDWIKEHRCNIVPSNKKKEYYKNLLFDIQNHPQKYFKYMIYMCLQIEKFETKSFQFFPLRNDVIPKYIPIDTTTLIKLFVHKNQNEYLNNVGKYEKLVWNTLFNLNDPIFTSYKDYQFDNKIYTDGLTVSIQLIHKSCIALKKNKHQNMKNKNNEIKQACLNKSHEETVKYREQIKEKKEKIKIKIKKNKNKKSSEFKLKSKEEQDKIRAEIDKKKHKEFPYLDELNEEQYNELKISNWVVNDPGKRCLVYLKNSKGKTFRYSNKQHLIKTKRLKYQRLLQNYKNKLNVNLIEKKLANYNSKTCNIEKFKDFIKIKTEVNNKLFKIYKNKIFRKYKWYGYINRKRAETELIRNIKSTYGNDLTICYGDWSIGKQMRNFISTPNLGLKRKLAEYFTVYNLDEFRTSCLHCKQIKENEYSVEQTNNMFLIDKKNRPQKIHSVLTYKMNNKRIGCINRDHNAVNNMVLLVNQFLIDKTRIKEFERTFKFESKNGDNHNNNIIVNRQMWTPSPKHTQGAITQSKLRNIKNTFKVKQITM